MPDWSEDFLKFRSHALPEDTFRVVRSKAVYGLSRLYKVRLTLISEKNIDADEILEAPAVFTIVRQDGSLLPLNGLLSEFEQLHRVSDYIFYKAVLVPKLWCLTLTHHNQVFIDKTIPEMIELVLTDGGLTSQDYELRLQGDYSRRWEFVCQYRETHFDFFCRWLEREGMYFYFEQASDGEKLIVTDTKIAHAVVPGAETIAYRPPSGLDHSHRDEMVTSWRMAQKRLPLKVLIKDYDYRRPSIDLTCQATVSPRGMGEVYLYGEHHRTIKEGQRLAQVRAEELLCGQRRYYGESTAPFIQPGFIFTLTDHYRHDYNTRYLTISKTHEASQAGYLIAGLAAGSSTESQEIYLRESFTAITADVQFRSPSKTDKPRFYGCFNAVIDAEGSGEYAEVDAQGRYKVILPFDLSSRTAGKASTWLRLVQPYTGGNHGFHFPLHKGTEVIVSFIDGDPDRPIILGAVPNPDNPSLITSDNQTMGMLTTSGGNKVHIEDQAGSQRILMHSPTKNSFIRIGAPNDPISLFCAEDGGGNGGGNGGGEGGGESGGEGGDEESENGVHVSTEGNLNIKAAAENTIIFGESTETIFGLDLKNYLYMRMDTTTGVHTDVHLGLIVEYNQASKEEYGAMNTTCYGNYTENHGGHEHNHGEHEANHGAHEENHGEHEANHGAHEENHGEHEANHGAHEENHGEHEANHGAHEENHGEHEANHGAHEENHGAHEANHGAHEENHGEHEANHGAQEVNVGERVENVASSSRNYLEDEAFYAERAEMGMMYSNMCGSAFWS